MKTLTFLLLIVTIIISLACPPKNHPKISFCPKSSRSRTCSKESRPVCAITDESCSEANDCAHTVQNSCAACSNSSITSYIPGKCFDLTQARKIYCVPQHRPENCGKRTEIVCGFYNNGSSKTLLSPCYACRDPKVKYYSPGTCSQDSGKHFCGFKTIPPMCSPPIDFVYNPVCVHVRNCKKEPCRYTAIVICSVCGLGDIDYYTDGECMTSCDSKSLEEFCSEENIGLVCAYTRDCKGDSCGTTMESPCVACGDASVGHFSDVECYKEGTSGGQKGPKAF